MKIKIEEKTGNVTMTEKERRIVHCVNPVSGSSRYYEAVRASIEKIGGEMLESEHQGHLTELVANLLKEDPHAHVVVYGGDGSVFEAVNGIMRAGAGSTASFSVIPAGSGNDFSTHANDSGLFAKGEVTPIDLIRVTAGDEIRYFANMMNIGFDCDVVRETYSLKKFPLLKGSMAYIAGVVKALAKKKSFFASITLEGVTGYGGHEPADSLQMDIPVLLTACANGQYCGGGFRATPYASLTDGLADLLVVRDITRRKFISLVGDYRGGTYISEDGVLKDKFVGALEAYRCRKMTIKGPKFFCLDGEIFPCEDGLTAEVVPGAVRFAAL